MPPSPATCAELDDVILHAGVRLSKCRRLLLRQGVLVPYSTLHRFAAVELSFDRVATTLPLVDGEPGRELQIDTGWMTLLEPDGSGRRRFRVWISTPGVSRYRFVWLCFHETTAEAIAACEAAWEQAAAGCRAVSFAIGPAALEARKFYGDAFRVLVPDNTHDDRHQKPFRSSHSSTTSVLPPWTPPRADSEPLPLQ